MRDSRVGTYGSIAVFMSLALRIIPLGSMSLYGAVIALLISGSLSRYSILVMLKILPSARPDGTGTVAGEPDGRQLVIGGLISLALCIVWLPVAQIISVIMVAFLAILGVAFLSHRQVGGYTGDVLGATQQVSEIAILIILLYGGGQI
jgi:adenosylcobinamide-GDP ribazoletransferase